MREKVHRAIDCIQQRTNKKRSTRLFCLQTYSGLRLGENAPQESSPFSPKDILSSAYCVTAQMQMCTCGLAEESESLPPVHWVLYRFEVKRKKKVQTHPLPLQ